VTRPLDLVEQRVIGSLLEKERTVPGSYPMTLNGLRTACNQTSGRDPITDLDDHELTSALDRLKADGFARLVHASHGARVVKYRQVLSEALELEDGERAVVTLLLLRGPQTPGELRSRAERLHAFADLDEVDAALAALAGRPEPLVEEQARQPGQKEQRWRHRLGPSAPTTSPAAPSAGAGDTTVTEAVLADGPLARDERVRATYTAVADTYADHLVTELDDKPFDCWLLERLVDLADGGPIADAGCGPGHVTFHLAAAGADVTGFDLTPAMVAEARRRFPELTFEEGDLTALPPPRADAAGWAVAIAWYSLVHLASSELPPAIALLSAAVRPNGWVLTAMHAGPDVVHLDEWFDRPVDIDFTFQDPEVVVAAFRTAGLEDVEWYRRGPYERGAETTNRLYVMGRRPA
jgi:uncharacterized protein YceH (UPF0502 family)/SAM-dependent methyltransferase